MQPDKVWYFKAYGLNCALAAAMGINGYVHLPLFHPWRDLDLQLRDIGTVDVHGGITYGPDDEGWIGFDTCHAFDVWSKEEYERFGAEWNDGHTRMFEGYKNTDERLRYRRWTVNQVKIETTELARQVAEADTKIPYHSPIWFSL